MRDIDQFVQWCRGLGCEVDRTRRRGHIRITHPGKPGVVFVSGTPSDWRALLNGKSQVRRLLAGRE